MSRLLKTLLINKSSSKTINKLSINLISSSTSHLIVRLSHHNQLIISRKIGFSKVISKTQSIVIIIIIIIVIGIVMVTFRRVIVILNTLVVI